MQNGNIRVVLAAENPKIASSLKDAVKGQNKAVIVGQAENEVGALSLIKSLRPDVAIIDSSLPYSAGMDFLPLSRISGLDTAQLVSEQLPHIQVILVNTVDTSNKSVAEGSRALTLRQLLALPELTVSSVQPKPVIFTDVDVKSQSAEPVKTDDGFGFAMAGYGLCFLIGLVFILTDIIAIVGMFIVGTVVFAALLTLFAKYLSIREQKKQRRDSI